MGTSVGSVWRKLRPHVVAEPSGFLQSVLWIETSAFGPVIFHALFSVSASKIMCFLEALFLERVHLITYNRSMTTILGIDAAWTTDKPSGIALIKRVGSRWRCIAVAPSYESFVSLADGVTPDWSCKAAGSPPNIATLARVAALLAGEPIALATIDMPVATTPIHARREADQQISKAYGGRGCSTHTPSAVRPGKLGSDITRQFSELGFEIATSSTPPGTPNRLVEVYPHPALLSLLGRPTRVPYKVGNTKRYWKDKAFHERIDLLLSELNAILEGLIRHIDDIPIQMPSLSMITTFASLKPIEDALDALICCWVGCEYLAGNAQPFGDETSAIWCPASLGNRLARHGVHDLHRAHDAQVQGLSQDGIAGRIAPSSGWL